VTVPEIVVPACAAATEAAPNKKKGRGGENHSAKRGSEA